MNSRYDSFLELITCGKPRSFYIVNRIVYLIFVDFELRIDISRPDVFVLSITYIGPANRIPFIFLNSGLLTTSFDVAKPNKNIQYWVDKIIAAQMPEHELKDAIDFWLVKELESKIKDEEVL